MIDENELWTLSFYRTSEIGGAMFFGRLSRILPTSAIQADMTRHFADESRHAWYWTECIGEVGGRTLDVGDAYQDRYMAAAGVPANLMEVLAITQVFEQRVMREYCQHLRVPDLHPAIGRTLERILEDEKWHVEWVRRALHSMEPEYGKDAIEDALLRCRKADREVYQQTVDEHTERLGVLLDRGTRT